METVDHLMVDDRKVMLADLTTDQKYYYDQMVDVREQLQQARRRFDQLQMAYKGFEDSLLESLQKPAEK